MVEITRAENIHEQEIMNLLQSNNLPLPDLVSSDFFIAMENKQVIGVIGLERYGNDGLLRSMVVSAGHRGKGVAAELVRVLEQYAYEKKLGAIYLLTETAPFYFEQKGYSKINRQEVPQLLLTASEFTHLCPVSAIVMKKLV